MAYSAFLLGTVMYIKLNMIKIEHLIPAHPPQNLPSAVSVTVHGPAIQLVVQDSLGDLILSLSFPHTLYLMQ